jgi:hypothetical protein
MTEHEKLQADRRRRMLKTPPLNDEGVKVSVRHFDAQRLSSTHWQIAPNERPRTAVKTNCVMPMSMSASDYGVVDHFEDANGEHSSADGEPERHETHP